MSRRRAFEFLHDLSPYVRVVTYTAQGLGPSCAPPRWLNASGAQL